ncbi:MAG: hypothetical protein GKS06_09460 [Acidobacteria bacterium]|nr:hypothetical protein [Acidobacteriota bacterium]
MSTRKNAVHSTVTALGALLTVVASALVPGTAAAQEAPPLPHDVPVMLIGDPGFEPDRIVPFEATLTMGRGDKAGPLEIGEALEPRAFQTLSLERAVRDGRDVFVRSFSTALPDGTVVATGHIVLDAETLIPLGSEIEQQGNVRSFAYDWETFTITQSPAPADGSAPAIEHADLRMFEAAVHDIWMAALPLRQGFRARVPVMMAGGGGKYWAVPHVVGSTNFDPGNGDRLEAWVVELDWWGMGKDGAMFFPGGGANDTGGTGGKYWILKNPPAGTPAVVRVRTEVDADNDSVIQLQGQSDE